MFRLIKSILRFLISRRLWTFIGVILLCALIWQFGPLLAFGDLHPLETELNRLIAIGAVLILWLFSHPARRSCAPRGRTGCS